MTVRPTRNLFLVVLIAAILAISGCGGRGDAALQHAKAEWDAGRHRAALIELRAYLQRNPNDAEARWLLGRALVDDGAVLAAEKELEKALDLGWQGPEARLMLGEILLGKETFEQVLDLNKNIHDDPRFLGLNGLAQLGLGKDDAARALFDSALKLDPRALYALLGNYRLALQEGNPAVAEAALAAAEREYPDDNAVLQSRGWFELGRGNLDKGIEAYRRAAAQRPNHLSSRIGLIRGLLANGEIPEANAELARLQRRYAAHPVVLYYSAVSDYMSNKLEPAADKARLVLSAIPSHFATQFLLARILFQQGKSEQASDLLHAVLQKDPHLVTGKRMLAAVELSLKRPDAALAHLKDLGDADLEDPLVLAMMGEAYNATGDYQKGTDYFSKAVKVAPESRDIRAQLAQSRILAGDADRGVAELEELAGAKDIIDRADAILISLHLREGKFDEILLDADRLEKKVPDSAAPDNMRGVAYVMKQDYSKAREAFGKALVRNPNLLEARINLANLDVQDGRIGDAQQAYQAVLDKVPKHTEAATGLGVLELITGKTAEGVARLEAVRASDKAAEKARRVLAEHYLRQQDFKKALKVSGELWASRPDDPNTLLQVARSSLGAGRTKQALTILTSLNGLGYENTAVQLLLSEAQAVNGDLKEAQLTLDHVLAREPRNTLASVASARLALRRGDLNLSSEMTQKLLASAPTDPQVLALAADVALAKGNGPQAVELLTKLHERAPEATNTVQLAEALQLKGDYKAAGELLSSWTQQHPDDINVAVMLALNHDKRGATNEGIALLEKLNKQFPDNPNILNNLACLYQADGNAAALDTAEMAARLAPKDPNIADTLGWILISRGSLERGTEQLRKAVDGMPASGDVRYRLAMGLFKAGDSNGAREELKKALEIPRFDERARAEKLYRQIR